MSEVNHDEKFQQRWEFRRRDDDKDSSSDDSKSNSTGNPKDKKPPNVVTDLVILEDDDVATNTPNKLDRKDVVEPQIVEAPTRKMKPSPKKNNKSKKCPVKEKKSRTKGLETKEVGPLEDLKLFADSMIRELKVARQKICSKFREEARKLVVSKSSLGQTKKVKIKCSQKNNDHLQNGTESCAKPQNLSGVSKTGNVKNKVTRNASKTPKRAREQTTSDGPTKFKRGRLPMMARTTLTNDPDQANPLPHSTMPNVAPISQPQSHGNMVPLNDSVLTGVQAIETGKVMDPTKSYYHGVPVPPFQPELFGSLSHISCNNVSFLDRIRSQTTTVGVGFQPLRHQGPEDGCTQSSRTHSGIAFQDTSMNTKPPESVFPCNISNNDHNASREFVLSRLQDLKNGQFYLRNNN